jgi:hypothetical protein
MLNPEELIKDLTLKEKIQILSGYDAWYTHKIERLNIQASKCLMDLMVSEVMENQVSHLHVSHVLYLLDQHGI